jgi:hypothetical protein
MEPSDQLQLMPFVTRTSQTYPLPPIQSESGKVSMKLTTYFHRTSLTSLKDEFHEYECMKQQAIQRREQESQAK